MLATRYRCQVPGFEHQAVVLLLFNEGWSKGDSTSMVTNDDEVRGIFCLWLGVATVQFDQLHSRLMLTSNLEGGL